MSGLGEWKGREGKGRADIKDRMMEGVGCVLALMAMGREKRGWVKPGLDGAGASTDIGVSRRVVR